VSCTATAGSSGAQDGVTPAKANITVIAGGSVTCTFTNTLTVPSQACSPGYWKQPQHFGSYPWQTVPWASLLINPSPYGIVNKQIVPVTFDSLVGTTYGSKFSAAPAELAGLTFPEVISLGGGGIYALGRQSAAALLDSIILGGAYGFTPAQVIRDTNDAFLGLNGKTLQSVQSEFSALLVNENCPLGRSELPGTDLGSGIGHK
jgi:hypothetical protein